MNKSLETFKKSKKDKITIDSAVNVWVEEFFNTSVEEVFLNKNYKDSWDFYDDHQVTQEQHDWWVDTLKPIFVQKFKLKGKSADYSWGMLYLDCSPKIKKEDGGNR